MVTTTRTETSTYHPPGTRFAWELDMRPDQALIATDRYTSPEFHQLEIDRMWKRVWQMACREEELPEAGSYAEYRIADQSYLVVRGEDGLIRAFHNACRHRGNVVKHGCGQASELRCAYHHWAYHLDGRLKRIPDRELFCAIDDDAYGLAPIACDTWGGFVFVHPDPGAEPLAEFLGPIPEQLDPYHFEKMVAVTNVTTPISANWKVVVEAFLEVYHVQGIHPQLLPMLDDVNTSFENFEQHSRMIVPFGVPSMRLEDVPPQQVFEAWLASSGTGAARTDDDTAPEVQRPGVSATKFDEHGSFPDGRSARAHIIELNRRSGEARGHDYSGLVPDQLVDDWHYHIFPNLVFNTHAGGFLFFRIRPEWGNPDRCLFDVMIFRGPPAGERPDPAKNIVVEERSVSFGEVLDQDMANLPGVQRGLHSDGLDHITVSRQEQRIVLLHEVLDRYLAA